MGWLRPRRLVFKGNKKELTLGVELELQVLDQDSLLLTPQASKIIEGVGSDKFKQEMFQSTLEINTGICDDVHQVRADLQESFLRAHSVSRNLGLRLASTGTHPMADYRDRLVTPNDRYHALTERNQWMIRRMAVYGMHIHLGMTSGQKCIEYSYFFMHFVPHLIGLSASSPFWQGANTGLASSRPTTYEALPTAAMPYLVKGWKQFQRLFRQLIRAKAIESTHDLWWDLRPSPHNGTLELRFCDEPATLKEVLGIVAFVHALAHWFRDHRDRWNWSHSRLKKWLFRENKWRALRYGLNAEIIINRKGKTKPLHLDIQKWLSDLQPYFKRLGYEQYATFVKELLAKGNSSTRQTKVHEHSGDLREVVKHNVAEFELLEPIWPVHHRAVEVT